MKGIESFTELAYLNYIKRDGLQDSAESKRAFMAGISETIMFLGQMKEHISPPVLFSMEIIRCDLVGFWEVEQIKTNLKDK